MDLAVALLVTLAIASVIGTVLKQSEPYNNYLIQFGPFWFEVFKAIGLYDVYGSAAFLAVLSFLVVTTGVCIARNGPRMLKDMTHFRLDVERRSLLAFHHHDAWDVPHAVPEARERIAQVLHASGYRVRLRDHGTHEIVGAMRGAGSRLGYVFTHAAIVIICLGGLIDGNLRLKYALLAGDLAIETRNDVPASQVPERSRVPVDNPSFRASVSIPEGQYANVAFLSLEDGFVLQPLPFAIEVKDFRIEHYDSGQPKSFESDLVIRDPELPEPFSQTIAVNHPLRYRGYTIYQASFSDGGSRLEVKAWPLAQNEPSLTLKGSVGESIALETGAGRRTLELRDFRLFNINPAPEGSGRKFRNQGPTVTYRVRDEAGQAREYENYQLPVEREGRSFFISGMRESPAEPFRYLHIPADAKGGLDGFFGFLNALRDAARVRSIADGLVRESLAGTELAGKEVERFAGGGLAAVFAGIDPALDEQARQERAQIHVGVLRQVLGAVYLEVLARDGRAPGTPPTAEEERFFEDALDAIDALPRYGAPFLVALERFEHVQASGLQVARSPGKNVVYLGSILLIAGVFAMFYLPHRRFFARIESSGSMSQVLVAATGERDAWGFRSEYARIRAAIAHSLDVATEGGES